jgi:hypothetical protein
VSNPDDQARRIAQLEGSLNEASSDRVLMQLADFTELPCTDPIYMLVPRDEPSGLNQGGGIPRGVSRARWPTRGDEPMQHLFTLDLAEMPVLARWFGPARAAACFMHDVAGRGRGPSPELDIEWVRLTETDLATPRLADPPIASLQTFSFAVVPALVPAEVWRRPAWDGEPGVAERAPLTTDVEYTLENLLGALSALHARCGGQSIHLQAHDPADLIIQFDEDFVREINLGDAGLAYLYDLKTALWENH